MREFFFKLQVEKYLAQLLNTIKYTYIKYIYEKKVKAITSDQERASKIHEKIRKLE